MKRFLQMTAVEAEAALKPKIVDGKWRKPLLSGRQRAIVKKSAAQQGLTGQWVPGQGGWLATWDALEKHPVMRTPKGTKHQRTEFDRVRKVQEAMAKMPQKVEEHKKALRAAKPLKGLDKWLNEKETY